MKHLITVLSVIVGGVIPFFVTSKLIPIEHVGWDNPWMFVFYIMCFTNGMGVGLIGQMISDLFD